MAKKNQEVENDMDLQAANSGNNGSDAVEKKPNQSGKKKTKQGKLSRALAEAFSAFFAKDEWDEVWQGVENLMSLPDFDAPPKPVPGKGFNQGAIDFHRSFRGEVRIAVTCGTERVRYLELRKYIAMVERMHLSGVKSTILLENFKDHTDGQSPRGQLLGKISAESSAIQIIEGRAGLPIKGRDDYAAFNVYYTDRRDLLIYYLAAKRNVDNARMVEAAIAASDGPVYHEVPDDLLSAIMN